MTSNSLATFLSRKGQIVSVSWVRPMKTLQCARGARVEKHVTTTARAGVDYDHMGAVVAKRASGELPKENAGLPWGHWANIGGVDMFPHIIEHTPKGQNAAKYYLRFATLPGHTMHTTYTIDGQPATADQARAITQAGEWGGKVEDVFTVTADYITDIH